ncbi:MAG: alpha/beta hydrolase [Deltaproteobacteria bacterium]|nr:alpha/beta hydrolase [Nannocystaceae bacterium]
MSSAETVKLVTSGEAQLWSTATGSGIPLVLFNGGPGCDDYLGPVAQLISDTCRVVRFEPRGCGRSTWDSRYDLDTLLSDADAIRESYGFDRWIVAGHSAGPNVALAYAIRHPSRTLGVIGIAGGKIVDDRHWSDTYHSRSKALGEDTAVSQVHADPDVNRQGNATWREYCRRPALLRELATLDVPCVFINAGEDLRPNWPTQQLAELIPRARYVEIPGAGHYIWLTHASELSRELHGAVTYLRIPG